MFPIFLVYIFLLRYTSALSDSKHPRQSNNPGPVLCNTESLTTHQSGDEAGDGSAGCLFPSDGAYVADLYDCVGFVSPVDLTSSGYSDKANGICCPNRGAEFMVQPLVQPIKTKIFQRLPVSSRQPLVQIQQNQGGGTTL